MTPPPREPTSDECNANAVIDRDPAGNWRRVAFWYPQMGGYVGKCVVEICPPDYDGGDPCFEAWVWHDGEFPYVGADRSPVQIHHCMAQQFIDFGETVQRMQQRMGEEPSEE